MNSSPFASLIMHDHHQILTHSPFASFGQHSSSFDQDQAPKIHKKI